MRTTVNYHLKVKSDDEIEATIVNNNLTAYSQLNREFLQLTTAYAKANEHGVLDYLEEQEARNAFQALGKYLFSLLFQGDVKAQFEQEIIDKILQQNSDVYIRFRLNFQAEVSPEIINLPWEFICEPKYNHFLATHAKIAFSYQYNNLLKGYENNNNQENLRVLFTHYHPEDLQGIGYITVAQRIKTLTEKNNINYQEESNLSIEQLKDKIAQYKPHIFHLLTHGKSNNFAFLNTEKKAFWYDAQSFSYLFESWQPKLIILQCCESGKVLSSSFSGGAYSLIQKGIPAVIAWRYPLTQQEGWTFLEKFYHSLAEGNPVDKAVQEGRNSLAFRNNKTAYSSRSFGTPILWNNLQESQLFIVTDIEQKWQKLVKQIETEIYTKKKGKRKINALKIAELIGDDKNNGYERITNLLEINKEDLAKNPFADEYQDRLQIIYHNYKLALELYKNEEQPTNEIKIDLLNKPIKTLFYKKSLPDGINGKKSVFEYLHNLDLFTQIINTKQEIILKE